MGERAVGDARGRRPTLFRADRAGRGSETGLSGRCRFGSLERYDERG